jgi:small multidrug resistance family-3 protein
VTLRSVALFMVAALLEIGGAWLVWQAVGEGRAWWLAALGVVALGLYGFVASFQPDAQFGRVLAAHRGVFVAGSLVWGVLLEGYRPDRFDIVGAVICLAGVDVIMYALGDWHSRRWPGDRRHRRWHCGDRAG